MYGSHERQVREALRKLAAEPTTHDSPSASQIWLRAQFRSRYRPRRNSERYASTLTTAATAAYVLLLLLWTAHFAALTISITLVLATAAVSALLLCLRMDSKIRC